MRLYEPFPDRITVEGQEFRLTLWFDRVLRFYDVLDDPELTPEEKIVYDMEYIARRSIRLDLQCIVKTALLIFTHDGAR